MWLFKKKEQLKYKQSKVNKLLGNFHKVSTIIGMEHPFHYRNKVQAAFGRTRGGEIISGVYQSSTHNIVKIDSCLIEDKKADEIIVTIRKLIKSFKLTVFDERTMKGFLRHVLVKRGFKTNEIMVVLVTGVINFPSKNAFIKELLKLHPEITTIVQNVNNKFTSMILGDREEVLFGNGYIEDVLCGNRFRISPKSFYQINPVQTEVLYGKAIEFAELKGTEKVIDAYCGIGTIGLIAAKSVKELIGCEVNADAIKDAKINAKINNITNAKFICADAGEFMLKMKETMSFSPFTLKCSKPLLILTANSPSSILSEDGNLQVLGLDNFFQNTDADAILDSIDCNLYKLFESCILGSFSSLSFEYASLYLSKVFLSFFDFSIISS